MIGFSLDVFVAVGALLSVAFVFCLSCAIVLVQSRTKCSLVTVFSIMLAAGVAFATTIVYVRLGQLIGTWAVFALIGQERQ